MKYLAPKTIDEACQALASVKPGQAAVLAGGTDLLVKLRAEMIEPELVVDIKHIEGMRSIEATDKHWRIGAAVSGAELNEHQDLKSEYPGVTEAMDLIGSTQVQGRATLAGNLCNASPAADSVPAMVAARAEVEIFGPKGKRIAKVEDVPLSPGRTSLEVGEFISAILLPRIEKQTSDAYLRFIPRTEMDIAVVGCGVSLSLDDNGVCTDARVSLGAVAPTVLLVEEAAKALIGTKIEAGDLETLETICNQAAKPIDDKRGTVAFRKQVAGVLARRAALIAKQRIAA